MTKQKKYCLVFLLKEQEVFTFIRKRKFNPSKAEISYRNKTFIIDVSKPTYSSGLKLYYFIDINIGQIFINESDNKETNAELIDMILSRSIVKQLTSNLSIDSLKLNIMNILIGIAIGGLAGYIAGFMVAGG